MNFALDIVQTIIDGNTDKHSRNDATQDDNGCSKFGTHSASASVFWLDVENFGSVFERGGYTYRFSPCIVT